MADQDLTDYAETTALADTDEVAIRKNTDGLWRHMTGANLKTAIGDSITHPLPQGYLSGMGLSNNGTDSDHDIDIATGECRDSADGANIALTSGLTKQIDVDWAEGTDAGGFPSGLTLSADTTYHVFVILKSDGTIDAGFDTDLSATNLLSDASDYSEFRRIGSIYTDGSSNIVSFSQAGDEFLVDPVNDYNASDPGTSAVLRALSVPTGIKVIALHSMTLYDTTASGDNHALLTSPDVTDVTPSSTIHDALLDSEGSAVAAMSIVKQVRTDTSAQVRTRISASNADVSLIGTTHGWIDTRDRL